VYEISSSDSTGLGRVAAPLQVQIENSLARYSSTDRVQYLALATAVVSSTDVQVDVTNRGDGRWTVAINAADSRGALAAIVGHLTAGAMTIVDADYLTLPNPVSPVVRARWRSGASRGAATRAVRPARRILGVFDVRPSAELDRDAWAKLRGELAAALTTDRLEDVKDDLIDRFSAVFRDRIAPGAKLLPISMSVTNEPGATSTELAVRSADTPGFLFAFANALADFSINVERAAIRTVGGEARDTFWVTDVHRRPIVDERKIQEIRVATTLIKQFTYLLPRSPNPSQALRQFNALIAHLLSRPAWYADLASLESPAVMENLADVMGVSRFLWEDFLRMQHENLFPLLLDPTALSGDRIKSALDAELRQRLEPLISTGDRVQELNAFKDREMFRIDLRHLLGRCTFAEFAAELTDLAEVAVEAAAALSAEELLPKYGRPTLDDGRVCPWCICALGKFGGRELGFGSDLEVIFVYEGEGQTDGKQAIHNSEYFNHLVQTFTGKLKARQAGIFEIDLRLRPFGSAGALASSLPGFGRYYSAAGSAEQFERLSLVRLRPIGGEAALVTGILEARDRFVYSDHPLDLANVLHLRQRQATELVPRGEISAKYSAGGSVDVEYFVQSWQIAVGSADTSVRVTNTIEAAGRLAQSRHLDSRLAHEIQETYVFLRRLIDALRMVRGHAKDLTIPSEQSREYAYLARRLKLESPTDLHDLIDRRMMFAHELWTNAPPVPEKSSA
jgi:glutamate-ammonia-ligase adenylyltransferase